MTEASKQVWEVLDIQAPTGDERPKCNDTLAFLKVAHSDLGLLLHDVRLVTRDGYAWVVLPRVSIAPSVGRTRKRKVLSFTSAQAYWDFNSQIVVALQRSGAVSRLYRSGAPPRLELTEGR